MLQPTGGPGFLFRVVLVAGLSLALAGNLVAGAAASGDVISAPTFKLATATEGIAIPAGTVVATFVDSNTQAVAGGFTAAINWGDGTAASGTVTVTGGAITVSDGHTYADEGRYSATVVLGGLGTSTATGTVLVSEGDVLSPALVKLTSASAATPIPAGTAIATFTDADTNNVAGDFSAVINWGDGTTTSGTVTAAGGAITGGRAGTGARVRCCLQLRRLGHADRRLARHRYRHCLRHRNGHVRRDLCANIQADRGHRRHGDPRGRDHRHVSRLQYAGTGQ